MRDFWRSSAWFANILIAAGSAVLPSQGRAAPLQRHTAPVVPAARPVIGLLHHFGRYVFIDIFFGYFIIGVFFVEMTFGDLLSSSARESACPMSSASRHVRRRDR